VKKLKQSILWRRIDTPGHDACALWTIEDGWRMEGTAIFRSEAGHPACLNYEVICDSAWRTRSAVVTGWADQSAVELVLGVNTEGLWLLNGSETRETAGLIDIDLGFTPATNLIQFRRLNLEVGQAVNAPVAYLHFPELTLGRLEHRYHRVSHNVYNYEAPRFGYTAALKVSSIGFVTDYSGLWLQET
jgi:uncharacterized protein